MKRILLFIAALFLLYGMGYAQISNFPHSEGFENGTTFPTGWAQEIVTGSNNWDITQNEAHSGDYKAQFYQLNNQTTKLITPAFDLTQVNNPVLNFWYCLASPYLNPAVSDAVRVYYKTSDGGTWTLLQEFIWSGEGFAPVWFEGNLALPNPSADYYIAIEAVARNVGDILLDDIEIAAGGTTPPPVIVVTDTTPYSEGFENNGAAIPTGWTQMQTAGAADWEISQNEAHSGDYKAVFPWINNHSTQLITPAFDLTQVTAPAVKFWYRLSSNFMNPTVSDAVKVYYKAAASDEWIFLQEFIFDDEGNYGVAWFEGILSLPNPSADYYIAFEAVGRNFGDILLDDIEIAAGDDTPPSPDVIVVTDETPFFEGFETNGTNIPEGWTTADISGTGQNWRILQYGTPYGEYRAAMLVLAAGHTAQLITPAFDISEVSNPTLKLWRNIADFGGSDPLTVYYKTSATADWVILKEYLTPTTDWTEDAIALPNPSSEYYVAFEATMTNKNGVNIDNIEIVAGSTLPPPVIVVTDANPWNESFEDNGTLFAAGWTQEQIAGTKPWIVSEWLTHTGTYKAEVEQTTDNTVRLITPALNLSGVTEPVLKFWHYLAAANMGTGAKDIVKVYYKTSATAEWTMLGEYQNTTGIMGGASWEEAEVALPGASAEYYIAFEAISLNSRIVIDDINVGGAVETIPVISGESLLEFGAVYNNDATTLYTKSYIIENTGTGVLNVNFDAAASSSCISITGLPAAINPAASQTVTVTLNAKDLPSGAFEGNFTLTSNDPETPAFNVDVTASVAVIGVSPYIEETFDEMFPAGWSYQYFSRITFGGGINNSPCMRSFLHNSQPNGWLRTVQVDMGTNPVISFHYKALKDLNGNETVAVAEALKYQVEVSTDNGATWTTVKDVPFGTHTPSAAYKYVEIDAADFAGETCVVRFSFQPNLELLTSSEQINLYIDNVNIGTELVNELAAVAISGNQLPLPNETVEYKVVIENNGSATQTADTYSVRLMMEDEENGTLLQTIAGIAIAKGESKEFTFEWTPTESGAVYLYGEVVMATDQYAANNRTNSIQVDVRPTTVEPVTIGTGTEKYDIPYNLPYDTGLSQTLYYPHELGVNGGEIRSIIYKASIQHTGTAFNNVGIQVWVGETDAENLYNGWVAPSSLTEVYNGTMSFPAGEYDVVIPFNEPYEYKGKALVVYSFRKDNGQNGGEYLSDKFIGTAYPGSYRSVSFASFDAEPDPMTPPPFNSGVQGIPNTTFMIDMKDMGLLSGVVTDGTSPMADVNVKIAGTSYSVTTNAAGEYSFPKLTAGELSLEFSKYAYHTQEKSVTIVADGDATLNATMVAIAKFTVSGKVTGTNAPNGLEDVKILLTGYENYDTTTDSEGNYIIEGVYDGFTYDIHARLAAYYDHDDEIDIENANFTHSFMLEGKPFPVINIIAEADVNNMEVTWDAPLGFEEHTYMLDDGSIEGAIRGFTAYPMWYGNQFNTTDAGELTSVDVYGYGEEGAGSTGGVIIEIFDENRTLIGSSEQFELPANEWVNVPLNNIPYVGTFYAMVHWTTGGMGSNGVGIDKNGEYAEAGIDWSYNGTPDSWKHIVEVVPTESGAVMIRANANIESGTVVKPYSQNNMRRSNSSFVGEEISAEHPAAMNVPASIDVNALYAVHSAKATPAPAPVGYNVYRLIEGQDEADWTQLTELAADITSHTDTEWASLEDGGYQYAVKAEYVNNKWSRAALSNIVGKNMEVAFTVNITANAPDATVTGAIVTLINNDNPVYTYTQTAEDAAVAFVDVWKGEYSISVTKEGFEPYFADNITIEETGQLHTAHLLEITMTPFNLTVEVMETDAMLYWNNPSKNFFDDMEQHAVFTNENIGNYILHDGDGALTYELDIITGGKYDFPHSGEAGSFIVFDPNQTTPPNGNPAIAAHSGNQFIGSFAEAMESDDWLILPKHFVVEGSILKFYAKSLSGQFIERFKVGVSTTIASPEQFTFISEGDYVNVPDIWTEYTYDLSMYAGQEVFVSIVCVSNNAWLFMVDDIFLGIPDKNGSNAKSFSGYTIYLDDEQVATGLMDTEYKFTNLADGEHTAGVKAVYTSGDTPTESIKFTVEGSSINGNSIANVTVYGNRHNVHIVNPAGVSLKSVQITDIIGRVVYSGKASASAIIPVNGSNGIYAVKLIDNDGKVAVTKVYLSK